MNRIYFAISELSDPIGIISSQPFTILNSKLPVVLSESTVFVGVELNVCSPAGLKA